MSEVRDTPVKLFGWTITSSLFPVLPDSFDHGMEKKSSSSHSPSLSPKMIDNQSALGNEEQDSTSLERSSDLNEESKETSENSEITTTTTTTSEEKTTDLKRPDKILPCPRCNSADTKFCYYNNYNVSQPRHFCRNCQRYWTSGGSMRTVPVGSGRRKTKGWVSSDHCMHTESTRSSVNILSFVSSGKESLVTENAKNQSSDSVLEGFNNFQRFLPPQVTSSVSPPWPYQCPPNPTFYHIPVYWGCTVPFWSTLQTPTCLGKRTRDEASHESVRGNENTFVRARLDSQFPVPMKREKTQQCSLVVNGYETKRRDNRFVPETYLNLKANPAAMSRSMNFRESM